MFSIIIKSIIVIIVVLINQSIGFINKFSLDEVRRLAKASNDDKHFKEVRRVFINDDTKKLLDDYVMQFSECSKVAAWTMSLVQLDNHDNTLASYSNGYGNIFPWDKSSPRPTPDTRFCIGSISMQFTAMSLGKSLEDNEISDMYDAKLSDILGASSGKIGQDISETDIMTIRDLLAHKTGFPTFLRASGILPSMKREDVWRNLHYLASGTSGNKFRNSMTYSNWMYARAALIDESLNNFSPWETIISSHFFLPLGMDNSTFFKYPHDFTDGSFALSTFVNAKEQFLSLSNPTLMMYFKQYTQTLDFIGPAEGICTTGNDMIRYMKFILQQNNTQYAVPSRNIVKASQYDSNNVFFGYDKFQSPDDPTESAAPTYGLGLFKGYYRGYSWIGHSGSIMGYQSQVMFFPNLRIGIFLSSTSNLQFNPAPVHTMAHGILDILMQGKTWIDQTVACPKFPHQKINKLTPSNIVNCTLPNLSPYSKLSGTYSNPIWGEVTVTNTISTDKKSVLVRFSLGNAAHGCLSYSPNTDPENRLRIWFDNDSYMSLLNDAGKSMSANNDIEFWDFNTAGKPQALTYHFLGSPNANNVANSFFTSEFDPCSSNPCMNSGTCSHDSNLVNVFKCTCPPGFSGIQCQKAPHRDCQDLYRYYGLNVSGVNEIQPLNSAPFKAFCMVEENEAWTVIQRRVNGSSVSFVGNWTKYLHLFGELDESHWLGLENIHTLTNGKMKTLKIELCDCAGACVYEEYQNAWIGPESDSYRMHVGVGSGTAGSGLDYGEMFTCNNIQFSTLDVDSDNASSYSCAKLYRGGWWYNECYAANLNGIYYNDCKYPQNTARNGIEWIPWKLQPTPLFSVTMMIS